METPSFTAYNSATEPTRLDRLRTVWGYAVALADFYGNTAFRGKVAELHDHKGILTVTWRVPPAPGEKDFFLRAWKSPDGDFSDQVEHVQRDQRPT